MLQVSSGKSWELIPNISKILIIKRCQLQTGTYQELLQATELHQQGPLPSACATAAADLPTLPKGNLGRRGRPSVLQGNWWNRSLDRYFQELILWSQSLHLLTSRKALNPLMVTSVPHSEKLLWSKLTIALNSPFTTILCIDLPPLPLWSSLSELSEVLSPRLQSSSCSQIKLDSQL